jgi:nitroreductase
MALLRVSEDSELQLTPVLQDRWSPRAFDDTHVLSAADLRLMLQAARWAPSAGNLQPWSFIVGLRGDDTFDGFYEHLSRGNKSWAHRASALLVAIRQIESGPDHELPWASHTQYDLGQAAAHLSVQAHALGLHAHQFAGFDAAATAERFGVPSHWEVTTGIALGRVGDPDVLEDSARDKELAERKRRPLDEFVFTGAWGETPISFD